MIRTARAIMIALLTSGTAIYASSARIEEYRLGGDIDGENITFRMEFKLDKLTRDAPLSLVSGDVALLEADLPRGTALKRIGRDLVLVTEYRRSRSGRVELSFAAKAKVEGDWRRSRFDIPVAGIRQVSLTCDRADLEVQFPGALNVQRTQAPGQATIVTAYLGLGSTFEVAWKPEVRKLDAELVVACDANTVAFASVGVLRLDTVYTYRIIQGLLTEIRMALPEVNVMQVSGRDIRDWHVDRSDPKQPILLVTLGRPQQETYALQVECERALPEFPCDVALPVLTPLGVIRTSGFLMIGTDSAIKLQVAQAGGATQVDHKGFLLAAAVDGTTQRAMPSRTTFAYQYANMPYDVLLSADDIMTSLSVETREVLRLEEGSLTLRASLQLDIKDAPARDITLQTSADTGWTVTGVTGRHVADADVDVRPNAQGGRDILIPFKEAVDGTVLVDLQMEKIPAPGITRIDVPVIDVTGTRAQRGYLVAAAEKGFRLSIAETKGLHDVHTGSAPMHVEGAQQAFRFPDSAWSLSLNVERATPSIHSEMFHLLSLGDGVIYYSAIVTCHVSGAPIQQLEMRIPATIENVDVAGLGVESWSRKEDVCTVMLERRLLGDFTLLVTYDHPFVYTGDEILAGAVETIGTDTEVGYLALSSAANLRLSEVGELPASVIRIKRDEIPAAYASPVTAPIIGAYKYVRRPHAVSLNVAPMTAEPLLDQVADYVSLATRISKDGETITTATYDVKNASRQFLIVRLPDDASLWAIRRVLADGSREDIPSQSSAEGLLIPIERPRDPNQATTVEVEFAGTHSEMGFWSRALRGYALDAPTLADTPATFTQWKVASDPREAIAGVGGNMTPARPHTPNALITVAQSAWELVRALVDGPRGRRVIQVFTSGWQGMQSCTFSRTTDLSDDEPLAVKVKVVPRWIGSSGSVPVLMLTTVLGLGLLIVGAIAWRRPLPQALGLALLVVGVAQSTLGRAALAVLLILVVLMGILHLLCRALRTLCRALAQRLRIARERRRAKRRVPESRPEPESFDDPFEPDPTPELQGHVRIGLLVGVLLLSLGAATAPARTVAAAAQPECARHLAIPENTPVLDSVTIRVIGPAMTLDTERSAAVTWELIFEAEEDVSFPILPADSVLTKVDLGSDRLRLDPSPDGYQLRVEHEGRYRIHLETREHVTETDGNWSIALPLLPNMRNAITLDLPGDEIDVTSPQAVLLRSSVVEGHTVAKIVTGPDPVVTLQWRPRIRKTQLEKAVFFCDVNALAQLRSGVVEIQCRVRYQIAQGEVRELKVRIPDGMSVTSVQAPGLATWSFDPGTRQVEAILGRAVTGEYVLDLALQLSCQGLPYTTALGIPQIDGASRQRGALGIAAPETIQVRIDDAVGASAINVEDFPIQARLADRSTPGVGLTVRRAFRYADATAVKVTVRAEQVLPEIRVVEVGSISISDERIMMSTRLELNVSKAGVFSVRLMLPDEFEVETLSGTDISHWDEARESGQHAVDIHFNRRVLGATEINVVVARIQTGVPETLVVPKLLIESAARHSGAMAVSAERGVRLRVAEHQGVAFRRGADAAPLNRKEAVSFDILRPTWEVNLTTQVMAPIVKPNVLHHVELAEGMLTHRVHLQYRIENAGVKLFRVRMPAPGVSLSVNGRNISRVHPSDADPAVWEIELHGKVEDQYDMVCSYQVPYDPSAGGVTVHSLQTEGTDRQMGYLVITGGGRVQVEPLEDPTGLKSDDARKIPETFNVGDLSHAILCYRTLRPDYSLDLSVVRHGSADVLPATVRSVRLTSILSTSRQMLTRAQMDMQVGDLRYLRLELPAAGAELWSVLVNGGEVSTSREGATFNVPLEELDGEQITSVDIIYAETLPPATGRQLWRLQAPRFTDLPLRDILWTLFVPPELRCYGFDGDLERETDPIVVRMFDRAHYQQLNELQREVSLAKAEQGLNVVSGLLTSGDRDGARRVLQQSVNWSQGEKALNEDARVQLRNVVQRQVKMGLVNRREAVRTSNNIFADDQEALAPGFQDGNFTEAYAQQVEQGLTSSDSTALDIVAGRIMEQQAAAAGVQTVIGITLPEHGRVFRFRRALQNTEGGAMGLEFRVASGRLRRAGGQLWPAVLLFGVLWIGFARRAHRKRP